MKTKDPMSIAKVEEVVFIHSDNRSKAKWTLGIVTNVFSGPDNTVRAVRVKTSKSYTESTVQQLHPLELSCDVDRDNDCRTNGNPITGKDKLNFEATEFRPKRKAAAFAELKTIDLIQEGNELPQVD